MSSDNDDHDLAVLFDKPVQLYVSLFLDGLGEHLTTSESIRVFLTTCMKPLTPDGSFSCLQSNRSYCFFPDGIQIQTSQSIFRGELQTVMSSKQSIFRGAPKKKCDLILRFFAECDPRFIERRKVTRKADKDRRERENEETRRKEIRHFSRMSPDQKILYAAVQGKTEWLECVLTTNPECVDYTDEDGNTGAAKACWKGHIECLRAFICHGAMLDKRNKYGWTAFCHARRAGHRMCMLAILTHDVNLLDMY
jgi:hypothetical protein